MDIVAIKFDIFHSIDCDFHRIVFVYLFVTFDKILFALCWNHLRFRDSFDMRERIYDIQID